jgi:hypothetical protein
VTKPWARWRCGWPRSSRSRPTYYLNGHSFIEQELKRAQIGFRKIDNAFLGVDNVTALQAAADKLSPQIIRQRLDYWTLVLGPKFSVKERKQINLSRFYAIAQIEYCRNFIFKRNFPIHKLFERSCELGLWRLTGDKIAEIFGTRVNRRTRGKLAAVIDRIEHGHHVFRAYLKNAFLKQYEKFSTFLRNELVSNNLADFRLKKGLDHLDAVRERCQTITDRFAGFQAQWLNVHVDFPLLQRLALPITIGAVRYPGIKIHDPRVIRLLEVLLHGGTHVGGWTAKQIHHAVLATFHLSDSAYRLNQLRYDLRKLKGHGLDFRAFFTPTGSARLVELYGCGEGFIAYQHLIEKWGVWIIIAKSLTPIPFKIMAIAAGVAAMSPSAFLASAAVGRALHFAIVATLIALWGDKVMVFVSRYGRALAIISVLGLIGIAVVHHLR